MASPRTRLALVLAALALGGCAVVPAHDYDYQPASSVAVYAPPPPLVEYRGLPPYPGHVWIDGYWSWGGVRFDWVPGYWVAPVPGRVWVPPVWHRDGERWRQYGGRWEPRPAPHFWPHREPVQPAPPHLPRPWQPPEVHPQPLPPPGPQPGFRPERPAHPPVRPPVPGVGQVQPEPPGRPEALPQRQGEPRIGPAPAPAPSLGPALAPHGGPGREAHERRPGPPQWRDGTKEWERDRR